MPSSARNLDAPRDLIFFSSINASRRAAMSILQINRQGIHILIDLVSSAVVFNQPIIEVLALAGIEFFAAIAVKDVN